LVRTASSWFGAGLPTPSKGSTEGCPGRLLKERRWRRDVRNQLTAQAAERENTDRTARGTGTLSEESRTVLPPLTKKEKRDET